MSFNCKIGRVNKVQSILYMPTINLYSAYFGNRIHIEISKETALFLIDTYKIYYHRSQDFDWGHYKTIPCERNNNITKL